MEHILGIDIGGSGIKGAPVNVMEGILTQEKLRIPTPVPSTPQSVAQVIKQIRDHFQYKGIIGCGYPGVVRQGKTYTASNMDKSWIEADAKSIISQMLEQDLDSIYLLNDADAAGIAEMQYGAGKNQNGVVIIITVGTGIGISMFSNGVLVPNIEIGHLEIRNKDSEKRFSDATRKREDLSWKQWSKRFNEYVSYLEKYFWPDLIILGGGICKKYDQFCKYIKSKTPIVRAQLGNDAGIIGAALAVYQSQK